MGSMSASDAAPLPRLGEVFFDVRGSSRSMRLSWYADTGVAVFSIWQGGMCTGTFRLAIGDLPRMVETLQRGPGGQPPGPDPAAPGQAFGDALMDATAQVQGLDPLNGEARPDYQPGRPGYGPGSRPDHPAGQADYHAGQPYCRTGAEYLTERPDPLTGPAPQLTQASGYPAEPVDHRTMAAEYPGEVTGHWAGPADYLTGPSERQAGALDHRTEYLPDPGPGSRERSGQTASAGPAGFGDALSPGSSSELSYPGRRPDVSYPGARPDVSYPGHRSEAWNPEARPEPYPGRPDTSYPGASIETSYPGRSDASYPGARPDASYPGARPDVSYPGGRSDASYPGASTGEPHLRGTTSPDLRPGGPADDPYLAGTGPMAFPAEPPSAHYPAGTAAPGHDGAPDRSAADYPAHYGAAVSDDIAPSPPPESFPYGPPPGNRGPGGRHADRDGSFD